MKQAIKLRFLCGQTGYQALQDDGYPLPGLSTVRNWCSGFEFESGILQDVIDSVAQEAKNLNPFELYCSLQMDEISIKPGKFAEGY